MDQETRWMTRYNEVKDFIEENHRNPSRYDDNERGMYCNWIKHNKKLLNSGEMRQERISRFNVLLALIEENKRKNQYV